MAFPGRVVEGGSHPDCGRRSMMVLTESLIESPVHATMPTKKRECRPNQVGFLQEAKAALGLTWDELAVKAGIQPRALKNYRLPETSQGHRAMPDLAWQAIDRLLGRRKQ